MKCQGCGYDSAITGPLTAGVCASCAEAESEDARAEVVSQEDDAMRWLDRDLSVEPTWWSPKLTGFGGPILPGTTLVCARPGNGKTTLICNQILHSANDESQRTLVFPLETSAGKLRITLAAIEEGLNPGLVRRRQWDALPTDAKQRVIKRMGMQSAKWGERVRIVDEDRIRTEDLLRWLKWAHENAYSLVVLDHLHEVAWGDNPDKMTADMTDGMRKVRALVREHEASSAPIRLLAACQLRRPSGFDPLEEYMCPPLSAIKQSGAAEEVAAYVYMLYRSLQDTATAGDLKLVRGGQLPISSVAEAGAMKLNAAKHRDDGTIKGHDIKLYVQEDKLLDHPPVDGWKDPGAAAAF